MTEPTDEVLCGSCGRPLIEPASRALGLGPVCRRALRPPAEPAPGQLTLDLPNPTGDTT